LSAAKIHKSLLPEVLFVFFTETLTDPGEGEHVPLSCTFIWFVRSETGVHSFPSIVT
jgi:hypothetical protein